MEEPYSKREMDTLMNNMCSKMDENTKHLIEIKDQVIKTNGRVSSLEKWRSFITGGLTILSILVVPIILWFIKNAIM